MLVFIGNTPRPYAWGSRDALPEFLGTEPTGEPQAELWLGAHPGGPATVTKASPIARTVIDLIESDPDRYGVDGGHLPFLLKVLAIGAPLSLQVHPDPEQAAAGFAAEEAAGVPRDAPERNYGDPHHKPELLVALSEVTALSGFRPLEEVQRDLRALARAASAAGCVLAALAERCSGAEPERVRAGALDWVFGRDARVGAAIGAITRAVRSGDAEAAGLDPARVAALRALVAAHPGDPGVLVSLLLHLVRLNPGDAVYLRARQLHAYLSGIAVEIMAASDNVLRAGLTQKHVDIGQLRHVVDLAELPDPRFPGARVAPGLVAWEPDVPDFRLLRASLREPDERPVDSGDSAERVEIPVPYPLLLIVTAGRVRLERPEAPMAEVANAGRGQSVYVSAGEPVVLTGCGEAFLATVGQSWACREHSSET